MAPICRKFTVFGSALYVRHPLPKWTSERMPLLGDACHPMTPFMAQGAGMAIEDAIVLSRALTDVVPDDLGAALSRYTQTFLLCETPETPLVSRIRVGSRIPVQRATPGLAMFANRPPEKLRALYAAHPDGDDKPGWDALHLTLDIVRSNGCAWSFSGLAAGLDSCAAAVRDSRETVFAAVSVAGPNTAFSADEA